MDILNPPKLLLVIDPIIIGCIMIAKVYQELKKNGSQVALWKKLTGDTTPGHSKLQLAMHIIIKQLLFDIICFIIWISREVLRQLKQLEVLCHQRYTISSFFHLPSSSFSLFLPVLCLILPLSFPWKPLGFLSPLLYI